MKGIAAAFVVLASGAQLHAAGASVAPSYVVGREVARIAFVDDSGRVRSTNEWRGLPAIIAPIFTRCPLACPLIVENLERALASSNAQRGTYRVILFSFDPRDTPVDLQRFRERHRVPIEWTVARAGEQATRELMDSISFPYARTNSSFTHPNVIVAVTPELRTAKFLFGTSYRSSDLEQALSVARGSSDWLDRDAGLILAVLLFACVMSVVFIAVSRESKVPRTM